MNPIRVPKTQHLCTFFFFLQPDVLVSRNKANLPHLDFLAPHFMGHLCFCAGGLIIQPTLPAAYKHCIWKCQTLRERRCRRAGTWHCGKLQTCCRSPEYPDIQVKKYITNKHKTYAGTGWGHGQGGVSFDKRMSEKLQFRAETVSSYNYPQLGFGGRKKPTALCLN